MPVGYLPGQRYILMATQNTQAPPGTMARRGGVLLILREVRRTLLAGALRALPAFEIGTSPRHVGGPARHGGGQVVGRDQLIEAGSRRIVELG